MDTTELVKVRTLHVDGSLTVKYLNPDGTEPLERTASGMHLPPVTYMWDRQYKLSINTMYFNGVLHNNLMHLCKHDPFLFEEVLSFLELSESDEEELLVYCLMNKEVIPQRDHTATEYRSWFRALLDNGALSHELSNHIPWTNVVFSHDLFEDAHRLVANYDHPHFRAALLAVWIMQSHAQDRVRLSYWKHLDDLAFIESRFDEVLAARHHLARLGTLESSVIQEFLDNHTATLYDGMI